MLQVPLPWIMLPPETWESRVMDTVHRETEERAFDRIRQLSKMYAKGVIPTLAPMHRRALELEAEDMHRHRHHKPDETLDEVARRMRLRHLQAKALLQQASDIIQFAFSVGLEDMIVFDWNRLQNANGIPTRTKRLILDRCL